jgi:hypothetical protein
MKLYYLYVATSKTDVARGVTNRILSQRSGSYIFISEKIVGHYLLRLDEIVCTCSVNIQAIKTNQCMKFSDMHVIIKTLSCYIMLCYVILNIISLS